MTHTTAVVVYMVEVFGRDDGIYIFANEDDAVRFECAVADAGGDSVLCRQTVCHRRETDALIAAEHGESPPGLAT